MGKAGNDHCLTTMFHACEQRGACLRTPADRALVEALRRRTTRGEVVRPHRGMYARATWWEALPRQNQALCVLRTLQEAHPNLVFCRESAALAFGLPVSYAAMNAVHVATTRQGRRSSTSTMKSHVIEDVQPMLVRGIRVTPFDRTLFDCLRSEDFGRALAMADSALRMGQSRIALARSFASMGKGLPGTAQAMRALFHADALSESPGESLARAAMIELGFARPLLQTKFPRPLEPGRSYRVDFFWMREDGGGVIGEFDGMVKYEDPAMLRGRTATRALADERRREAQLSLYGMPIVRLSYRDIADRDRLARLLGAYGVPRDPSFPEFEQRLLHLHMACAASHAVVALPHRLGHVA